MALFATETWTMRHRLLLTIGAASSIVSAKAVYIIDDGNTRTTVEYGKRLPACWCRAC